MTEEGELDGWVSLLAPSCHEAWPSTAEGTIASTGVGKLIGLECVGRDERLESAVSIAPQHLAVPRCGPR